MSEYGEFLLRQNGAGQLRQNVSAVSTLDPDNEAKLQKLAAVSGVPVDALRETAPQVEAQMRVDSVDYGKMLNESPKLAEWLRDPSNTAIAHDDLETLSAAERSVDYLRELGAGALSGVGMAVRGFAEIPRATRTFALAPFAPETRRRAEAATDYLPWFGAAKGLDFIGGGYKQLEDLVGIPTGRRTLGTETARGLGQLGPQVLQAIYAPASLIPTLFAQGVEQMRERAVATGQYGTASGAAATLAGGAVTAGLERLSLFAILQRMPDSIRGTVLRELAGIGVAAGVEGAQEVTEAIAQNALTAALLDADQPIFEGLVEQGVPAAGAAGIARALLELAVPGRYRLSQEADEANRALDGRATLEGLRDILADSKLQQRAPEAVQRLFQSMKGQLENVGVPVEAFKDYAAAQKISPHELALDLTGRVDGFSEAVMTGGDVRLPTERLLTSKHLDGLLPNVRVRAAGMTAAEADAWMQSEAGQQFADQLKSKEQEAPTSDRKVYDEVLGQLEQAGVSPIEARTTAEYVQQRYRTRAARTGVDAYELFKERPISVTRELQMPQEAMRQGAVEPIETQYPAAAAAVDGRTVRKGVPNRSSIAASLADYDELPGLREVPLAAFTQAGPIEYYSTAEKARTQKLAEEIRQSGEISPLIVVIDEQGPYILEGGHRFNALRELGAKSFPALVVIDREAVPRVADETPAEPPELAIGAALRARWTADFDAVLAEYSALTGAFDSEGGRVLNTDLARELSPEYRADRSRSADVHEAASDFVKEAYRRKLAAPTPTGAQSRVLFSAGGTGAGKTTGLRQADTGDAEIVYDTNANGFESTVKKIDQALAAGRRVQLVYTYRDPVEALRKGALPRAARMEAKYGSGRTVPLGEHLRTHLGSRETIDRLAQHYSSNPNVEFAYVDNSRGKGNAVVTNLEKLPKVEYTDVREKLTQALEDARAAGEISERVYRGFAQADTTGETRPDDGGRDSAGDRGQPEQERARALAQDDRGYIQIGDERIDIGLLENADASTLIHELGHAFLEEMRLDAQRAGAPQQILDDWAAIKARYNIASDTDPIPVEAHEGFAENWEEYLMEGKAPAAALREIFQRFRAWLAQIYRGLRRGRIVLNDDVRRVFDRILATDEEIAAAERESAAFPLLFTSAEDMGVSEDVFRAYRDVGEKAHARHVEALDKKVLGDIVRELEQWWKDETTAMRKQVDAEADQLAHYRATAWLKTGKLPDDTTIDGVDHARLSGDALKLRYANEKGTLQALRRAQLYQATGGLDPDDVATLFGFASGDAMVRAIVNNPSRGVWVDQQTTARMKTRHGDYMEETARMAAEAQRAVHDDLTGEVLGAELKAMRQLQRRVERVRRAERAEERRGAAAAQETPGVEFYRALARSRIGQLAVKDIDPAAYLRAEQKAGKMALAAMGAKDYTEAGLQKQRQLLNHYFYREALKARDEETRIFNNAHRLTGDGAQAKLGLAGKDYQDRINEILEQYEFKRVSGRRLDRRAGLLAWVNQQEADGYPVVVPDSVLEDARQINYRQLTMDELRAVDVALRSIEHLARYKNKLIAGLNKKQNQELENELLARLAENYPRVNPPPIDEKTRTLLERTKGKIERIDAALLKVEQMLTWMDGGQIDGPWHSRLFRPFADAQAAENKMTREYTEKLAGMLREYAKDHGYLAQDKVYQTLPDKLGKPAKMTKGAVLALALNTGNAGNLQRVLDGYGWQWDNIRPALDDLTEEDWKFVRELWALTDRNWPQIADLEQRLTGITPPRVEGWAQDTEIGAYLGSKLGVTEGSVGGYYPIMYKPGTAAGDKQADASAEKLFDSNYVTPAVEHGFTRSRQAIVKGKQILLDLEALPRHEAAVAHYLTHHEAVLQVNRILSRPAIAEAITDRVGAPYLRAMRVWLAGIANDRNTDMQALSGPMEFFRMTRLNASIAAMGFKWTTIVQQPTGLFMSADVVNPVYLGKALQDFTLSPLRTTRFVWEKSAEMRFRGQQIDRDLRDNWRRALGKDSPVAWVRRHAFDGIVLADLAVSVPTWAGAYRQALGEGLGEDLAIASADRAVRLSQGAAGAKDVNAFQRANEAIKLFDVFGSYFNVLYNRLRDLGRARKIGRDRFIGTVWRSFTLLVLTSLLAEWLAGRAPDDEDERAAWAARTVLLYPFMSVPLLRDVAGKISTGFDSKTPLNDAANKLGTLLTKSADVATGEAEPEDLVMPAGRAAGYLFGLPSQFLITGDYMWDVITGDEDPDSLAEFMHNLLYRRKED